MHIFYVEDNPVDIDLLKRHLKKFAPHITMDSVRSQKEALVVLRGPDFNKYDLVLTDMRLPDGDGIAILSHIRGNSLPLAVVVLTGQGDEETAVSVLKAGADDYLSKRAGYLERLPKLLDLAVGAFKKGEAKKAKSIHVLYLEHSNADIDLTRRHFVRYASHVEIKAINTGGQFREIFNNKDQCDAIDVFLLDYRLPGANAIELYKDLILETGCDIPTVLISGKGDEEIATNALKLGIFDYLSKNQGYLYKLPSIIENAHYNNLFKREHDALAKSEAKYRSMMESFTDPIYICSPQQTVEYMNPAMIRRIGRDATGERCHSAVHDLDQKCDWCGFENIGDQKVIENDIKSPFDNRNYHVTIVPIEKEDGTESKMTICRDTTEYQRAISEKEKAQTQMLLSQKMEAIGNLAGGIAHDFNNILSSIIGFTELALDDAKQDTIMEDNLQEIYSAGKRAKDLVRQILLFARQTEENVKPMRVDVIVKEVLSFIRSSTPSNIEIRQNLDCDSYIMGNPTQVHQIMMNLCTNAAHAMEEDGGVLEVGLSNATFGNSPVNKFDGIPVGEYIKLTVSDNGIGITPDIQSTIFDPYFTTKEPGEGTGMGLAMVKGIVENYGGKIFVDSLVGKGTTFTIVIPATKSRQDNRPYEPQQLPEGSERILFVDDEVPIAKMGGQILERLGYSVTMRTSSIEAIEIFKAKPNEFDLVITDMTMPNLTGDKLAVELMKIRPDIPVILCTGYSKKISDETASEIGIKAFAYKPVVKADLAKTVRKVLDEAKSKNQG